MVYVSYTPIGMRVSSNPNSFSTDITLTLSHPE